MAVVLISPPARFPDREEGVGMSPAPRPASDGEAEAVNREMAGEEALAEPRMVVHGDKVERAAKAPCADKRQTCGTREPGCHDPTR